MRLSRALLKQRVNASTVIRCSCEGLTSFSGLDPIRGYLGRLDFTTRLRSLLGHRLPRSDYPGVAMVLLLIALILTGGRRL